jgi:plastocyanin
MFGFGRDTGARVLRGAAAMVVGGVVVFASTALIPNGSAGAAPATPKTITVTFGDKGPTPTSPVRITAGDTVVFVNKITQTGTLALPNVTAQVQSASVTVKGAAAQDFALPAYNKSVSLTYPSAGTVSYTARYTYKLLPLLNALGINLVPDTTAKDYKASLAIAAASGGATQQPAPGGVQPAPGAGAGSGPGSGSGSGSGSGGNAGAPAGGGNSQGPVLNAPVGGNQQGGGYQPQQPGVADKVVPHGTGSPARDARPAAPLAPPQVNGGTVLPDPHGDTEAILTGSAPNAGLGLPAVLAIILLSVVTAALVRALINQRRTALDF